MLLLGDAQYELWSLFDVSDLNSFSISVIFLKTTQCEEQQYPIQQVQHFEICSSISAKSMALCQSTTCWYERPAISNFFFMILFSLDTVFDQVPYMPSISHITLTASSTFIFDSTRSFILMRQFYSSKSSLATLYNKFSL